MARAACAEQRTRGRPSGRQGHGGNAPAPEALAQGKPSFRQANGEAVVIAGVPDQCEAVVGAGRAEKRVCPAVAGGGAFDFKSVERVQRES